MYILVDKFCLLVKNRMLYFKGRKITLNFVCEKNDKCELCKRDEMQSCNVILGDACFSAKILKQLDSD